MANRLLCTVLDEMRECVKTSNFSYLMGLIEEAQSLGNRMEAHLYDIKDYDFLLDDIQKLKKKKKELKGEVDAFGVMNELEDEK